MALKTNYSWNILAVAIGKIHLQTSFVANLPFEI